jgi:hypothetical protein
MNLENPNPKVYRKHLNLENSIRKNNEEDENLEDPVDSLEGLVL